MIGPSLSLPAAALLLVAKSSALVVIAWIMVGLLRRSPAAARHVVWLTAIAGVLVIPFVSRYAPISVRVLPSAAPQITAAAAVGAPVGRAAPSQAAGELPPVDRRPTSHASSPAIPGMARLYLMVWLTVAAILLVRFAFGFVAIARLMRRGRAPSSPDWSAILAGAARSLDVRVLPRLIVSAEVDTAFAFDLVAPTIVVPTSAAEWPDDRRRSVLLHELAHIRRRDLAGHCLGGIACAINWFNPFVWFAARQLRIESELASDEMVLGAGVRPSAYAQHLLDLVMTLRRRAPAAALAMARPKELEGRLIAILDPIRTSTVVRRQSRLVAAVLALCAISIGAVAPAPRLLRVPAADEAPAAVQTAAHESASMPTPSVAPSAHSPSDRPAAVMMQPRKERALSSAAVASLLRYGTTGIMNPMIMLLREADSLRLTGVQADSIATLNRQYMIRLSAIWSPVSAYYISHERTHIADTVNSDAVASRETADALAALLPALDGLLTPEQRSRVSSRTAPYLDPVTVAASLDAPDGVFVPADQLYGLRGRGRGGG